MQSGMQKRFKRHPRTRADPTPAPAPSYLRTYADPYHILSTYVVCLNIYAISRPERLSGPTAQRAKNGEPEAIATASSTWLVPQGANPWGMAGTGCGAAWSGAARWAGSVAHNRIEAMRGSPVDRQAAVKVWRATRCRPARTGGAGARWVGGGRSASGAMSAGVNRNCVASQCLTYKQVSHRIL